MGLIQETQTRNFKNPFFSKLLHLIQCDIQCVTQRKGSKTFTELWCANVVLFMTILQTTDIFVHWKLVESHIFYVLSDELLIIYWKD